MRLPAHTKFLKKAVAALVSAVEIYNKPSFKYREESFSILAINGWELLLKAKILKDSDGDLKSLLVYETRKTKKGSPSKKKFLKKNRSGNAQSISLTACIDALDGSPTKLPKEVKTNLTALVEIRDNSIHYVTANKVLSKQVQEISSATVKNFVLIAKDWFNHDFSSELNVLLPLSFISPKADIETLTVSPDEGRLIEFLKSTADQGSAGNSEYAVALKMRVRLEKSNSKDVPKIQISNDPDAIKVNLGEDDLRDKYPWDHTELCKHLSKRYRDFKQNQKFHDIKKTFANNKQLVNSRFLDVRNPKSAKKDFYSQSVLGVFDKHYIKVK
jgi:hypothetical protein